MKHSSGILMWEVYSDAAEPYAGMTPNAVRDVIVKDEYRMPIPKVSYLFSTVFRGSHTRLQGVAQAHPLKCI